MSGSASHVFISGIAGFLGSHLAEQMLQLGHRVTGCDNLQGGYIEKTFLMELNFTKWISPINNDSTHSLGGVEIVFHTAATAYDGFSVFSPYYVTQNVFSNTVSLASASIDQGVKRFVFVLQWRDMGINKFPIKKM
ncbi:MAG: NAD-dependent epimerase/dehydratase family protein [Bdellovibrionales bacterium]